MASRQLDLWSAGAAAISGSDRPALCVVQEPPPPTVSLHVLARRPPEPLDVLGARAQYYVDSARAARTRTAYERDFAAFAGWCSEHRVSSMPASPATLACYLTHLAETGRKVSTVRRARVAIGIAHADAGAPRPDHDPRIRTLERGMGKVHGTKEEGAEPLVIEQIERIVDTLGGSARDQRDRALLLLGFAGAFRGSELVAIRIEDLRWRAGGMDVFLARSKEDELGAGVVVKIDCAQKPELCAVQAVREWAARVGQECGPLLRRVAGRHIAAGAMQPRAISRVIQRLTAQASVAGEYSSHSLRAGLATSAYAHGISDREIQAHGRWKDPRSLGRYIDLTAIQGSRNLVAVLC